MAGCLGAIAKEFKLSNAGFQHHDPRLFATSQWHFHPIIYAVYRSGLCLYYMSWLATSVFYTAQNVDYGPKWFIYLTNQGFLILNCHLVWSAVTSIHYCCKNSWSAAALAELGDDDSTEREDTCHDQCAESLPLVPQDNQRSPPLPLKYKISWILYALAANVACIITIGYWGLLFRVGEYVQSLNFHVHAMNSVYVVADIWMTGMPVRLLHVWLPLLGGCWYLGFSLVYWAAGGTDPSGHDYIYPVLDYGKHAGKAAAVVLVAILVAVPLVQCFLYVLYQLRMALYRCVERGLHYRPRVANQAGTIGRHSYQTMEQSRKDGSIY